MTTQQMLIVVQNYIFKKKGVRVKIAYPKTPNEFFLLTKAFNNCK